jgi:Flp pilus assembly pilin Flp
MLNAASPTQLVSDRVRALRRRFMTDSRGANLVEYIILVGVIALIAIAGFKVFGGKVRAKVDEQSGSVGGINGAAK